MDFLAEAKRIEPEIIKNRRALHQHPELSYHESWTSKFISERVEALGIPVRRGVGGNGVVGTLKGSKEGKVVALRADMDALPVTEAAEVDFKSKVDGVMHACGHDTHMAMLIGAAEILSGIREGLHGTVKFLFQPAEEHGGRGGALPMIEDGVMLDPKVDYVFGLHIDGDRKAGEFGVRAGPVMAAPDTFKIRIEGRGGHGSAPHRTIDPVYIAANVILGLQGISARMVDPVRPFVITVGSVHSGTKENIIPDYAVLEGTIRTLDEDTRRLAKRKVAGVVGGICRSFGGSAEVEFEADAYPVTINDPRTTEQAVKILETIRGTRVKRMEPILGGEDFSRFLQKAPGMFYFLGAANPAKGCVYPNHSSKFKVDEDVLKYGAASLAMLAFEFGREGARR
ncbi:MAG: amidohydrolase [Nitrososphaerota archaeon]|nr:amidohydrolase [Nitrososphaerota archaeon]MDG6947211.1 amidohydrolase [Nitrososphaerota archaeon]